MVCQNCKNRLHEQCRGETWCDCQHRTLDEVLHDVDRLANDPSYGVRRERPVRKPSEPSDTFVGTDAAAARIAELAAADELTALLQEMDADGHRELREIGQAIEAGDYVITSRPLFQEMEAGDAVQEQER